MEDFCGGSSFWDSELTWNNNSWPQFTECLQHTLIQWVPCGWLWISTPFYIYFLLSSERNPQPIRCLLCTKLFCSLILLVVSVIDLVKAVDRPGVVSFDAEVLAPILWILTIILHSVMVMLERSRDVVRSPVLFLFWVLSGIGTLIPFYSSFMTEMYDTDAFRFGVLCVKYFTVTLLLFLNCFAEYYREKPKGHNPELSASVLAWITFAWVDRTMLKGFKKPLVSDDVYDLHPRDVSHKGVKKFLSAWRREQNRKLNKSLKKRQRQNNSSGKVHINEKTALLSSSSISVSYSTKPSQVHVTETDVNVKPNIQTYGGTNGFDDQEEHKSSRSNENGKIKVSFFKTCVDCYWREMLSCQWGMVMYVAMNIVSPIILGWLISFTENPSERTWHGYIYALTFIVCKILYTVFGVMCKFLTNCLSVRVRSATISAVFRKALTMSSEARKESTVGEIVNLMSVDSSHIEMMINYSFWMWISWAFLILSIYLLYTVVGLAFLAGLVFVVLMFTTNLWALNKMRKYQDQIMIIKDERVKIVNEVLNGIKVIKLYAWEPMFIEKIKEIREKELHVLFKYAVLDGVQTFAWTASIFWMMYFMILTFILTDEDHYLDANTSFLTMNYINVLKLAINIMPILVKDWIKAANSSLRMGNFLNSEDLNQNNLFRDTSERLAVRIVDADFAWEKQGLRILTNLNLSVKPGKLVAVVGTVGSGKSSLLSAMLGEMHKLKGYSNLNSSVAYVPQQAWIQNDTLRGNILFGRSYDPSFYQKVLSACALHADLDIMPAGDSTEIGEKGINLSGGQKQRVSLARAVYSQADIYLMDDPLSAVDSHVGRHIFDHVFGKNGILHGKTIILVTHGVQWLPHVDHIVVMNNGSISESGSYDQLIEHNGPFAQFLAQYLIKEDVEDSDEELTDKEIKEDMRRRLVSVTSDSDTQLSPQKPDLKRLLSGETPKKNRQQVSRSLSHSHHDYDRHRTFSEISSHLDQSHEVQAKDVTDDARQPQAVGNQSKLISEEEMAGGKVKWSVYLELVKGMGVGSACVVMLFVACYHITYNLTNVWMAEWNDDLKLANFTLLPANSSAREERNTFYLGVYTGLGLGQTVFVIAYAVLLQVRHISASRKLHADLLQCVMRAPMSFFDTTPIGRILNRFSQDIEILDNDIFLEAEVALDNALRCVGRIVIISYTMPIFLSVVVPVLIVLYIVQQFYIRTSCQLRRIASNNRSPVFAHFSETLSGVSVIRAYQAQERFITDSQNKIDNFQKAVSAAWAVNKWLETRLDMLSYVIIAAAGIFAVVSRDDISPGLVGLAVSYALTFSQEMNIFTIVFGDLETHIVSVERIREYSVIKSEAQWATPNDSYAVDDQWPVHGQIQFVGYSTRYRDGLDLVLKKLDCSIRGGEKVGIVGRTGAGKSSLVLSVFRLIEAVGGKIVIDGVDISKIGLHALRRKITILPQDPVLFAGSLRMNLDPFQEKSDPELWTALEHSHLKSFVDGLPDRLDHDVGEGGENLSMGQRQLVCLARTLLRKTKILILDEATAAVDMETDDLIQKTIRTEFSSCTILTIAHRLNTVMDYDRILVLDKGMVAEFDSPENLMANQDSIFYSMASHAGLTKAETKSAPPSKDT